MRRVAIFGGTGLLGQHTARALVGKGYDVTLIARNRPENLLAGLEAVQWMQMDAWGTDRDELTEKLQGHDGVVYALGPDDRVIHAKPADAYFQTMLVDQTERILQSCKAAGIKKACVCGSYFSTWDRMHPELGFSSRHVYVKARNDQARRAIECGGGQEEGGMDVSILEIPYVFGTVPGQIPMWRDWLFERLRKMPVIFYPKGGSSVVTAEQVGQAAAGVINRGVHGKCYPLADLHLTWRALLQLILPEMGKAPQVFTVPRGLAEPIAKKMGRQIAAQGKESGIDPAYLMQDIMYREIFVRAESSLEELSVPRGGVEDAIRETVRRAYEKPKR